MKSMAAKQLSALVGKEFRQMLRDRKSLFMLVGVPVMQIVIFGFALTNEITHAKILVEDYSRDPVTQRIVDKIQASTYFDVEEGSLMPDALNVAFRKGQIKLAVVFPVNFGSSLLHLHRADVQIIADASDPNTAVTLTKYLSSIIADYQMELDRTSKAPLQIEPEVTMLYNPELKGAPTFVPGVVAFVIFLICIGMTSISVVKEKELGTMEVLLVSPLRPALFLMAKGLPYLAVSLLNLIIVLLMSVFLLDMPIRGSIVLLLAESVIFIVCALAIGMVVSITSKTQQDAFMNGQLNMMAPAYLLTGFLFPVENMPLPLRLLANLVPSRWYYIIVKDIMLKGMGLQSIWKESLVLVGMTVVLLWVNTRILKVRLQ